MPPAQGVAGRRVAISPGHGYYFNGANWVLQRPFLQGIVEDFVNHDITAYLNNLLVADGADVRPTRNLDRAAGAGESGFPKWQEAARYHVKALGADPSVWNEAGFTHLEQDIRCRPRYANAIGAELLVSIHNNGGGGTGTETLYDTGNAAAADSKRLADIVHAKLIAAIRRDYNPNWRDRLVKGFNGSYGENRLATRPAIIIEIAFMDFPTPDNAALRDERFKQLAAAAIRDGIREFLEGPAPTLPATPVALLATGDATGIALAWTDAATNETGYRVERKIEAAVAWTALATLPANSATHRDAAAAVGETYLYRVVAFNSVGDSAPFSNEATGARLTPPVRLALASVAPATMQAVDWDQDAVFTITAVDDLGRPAGGATVLVQDALRNTSGPIIKLTADATGQFTYRSTVPRGQAEGIYAFNFQAVQAGATASAPTTRQVRVSRAEPAPTGGPTIVNQPTAQAVTAGATVTFRVVASGLDPLAYQWRRNGIDLPGANGASLLISTATTAASGDYAVVVTNRLGVATSLAAPLAVDPAAWLSNVSLRTTLAAGQRVIVGFVVEGGAKELLIRASGPALIPLGLGGTMADPRFELYSGAAKVAENNDWPAALGPRFAAVGAFGFPVASRDAALLRTLVDAHTVWAAGPTGGLVLVEVYDAGIGSASRLINLSARNRVGTGPDILIAGFNVSGVGTLRVLVRGSGPALTAFNVPGVLADPILEVFDSENRMIARNDDWDGMLALLSGQAGAFPFSANSRDAALLLTLAAGRTYTVQVSGKAGGVGEGLVEVYALP